MKNSCYNIGTGWGYLSNDDPLTYTGDVIRPDGLVNVYGFLGKPASPPLPAIDPFLTLQFVYQGKMHWRRHDKRVSKRFAVTLACRLIKDVVGGHFRKD